LIERSLYADHAHFNSDCRQPPPLELPALSGFDRQAEGESERGAPAGGVAPVAECRVAALLAGDSMEIAPRAGAADARMSQALLIRQDNSGIYSHPFPQKTRKWMGHHDSI
jgi:hypothetical protein